MGIRAHGTISHPVPLHPIHQSSNQNPNNWNRSMLFKLYPKLHFWSRKGSQSLTVVCGDRSSGWRKVEKSPQPLNPSPQLCIHLDNNRVRPNYHWIRSNNHWIHHPYDYWIHPFACIRPKKYRIWNWIHSYNYWIRPHNYACNRPK